MAFGTCGSRQCKWMAGTISRSRKYKNSSAVVIYFMKLENTDIEISSSPFAFFCHDSVI